jgi:hypothetical protein
MNRNDNFYFVDLYKYFVYFVLFIEIINFLIIFILRFIKKNIQKQNIYQFETKIKLKY